MGLSVFALGFLAFLASGFVSPTFAADPDPVDVDAKAAVRTQTDNLRNLFEVAGRNGFVTLTNPPDDIAVDSAKTDAAKLSEVIPKNTVPNCLALGPLFDGGQGGFATGLFTELATDWPETAELAATLSDLTDPGYDGRALAMDLSRAGECGPSFLPWELLANPGRVLSPEEAASLTNILSDMKPVLRQKVGVQIAIRAGLAGNRPLMRRVSDTLVDSGLHGSDKSRRYPEHVLLDAIQTMSTDAVGARARLSWLAERDGPEQLIAIDLMRQIEAAPIARSELKRLSDSQDADVRGDAQQRLLATAIEDADIELVTEMILSADQLIEDPENRRKLAARLENTIETGDVITAIQAMDVMNRLELKGVEFDAGLKAKMEARVQSLIAEVPMTGSETPEAEGSDVVKTVAPNTLTGPELVDYIGSLSTEIDHYQEVLSRG